MTTTSDSVASFFNADNVLDMIEKELYTENTYEFDYDSPYPYITEEYIDCYKEHEKLSDKQYESTARREDCYRQAKSFMQSNPKVSDQLKNIGDLHDDVARQAYNKQRELEDKMDDMKKAFQYEQFRQKRDWIKMAMERESDFVKEELCDSEAERELYAFDFLHK